MGYRVVNVTDAYIFLTIVGDFTRATWNQLLRNRTQIASTVKSFFAMVETQFNTKITLVRSDNGIKFINSACTYLFLAKTIVP